MMANLTVLEEFCLSSWERLVTLVIERNSVPVEWEEIFQAF
jgi:hypothetical protein